MKYTLHFFAAALMTAAMALSCNKTVEEPVTQPDIRTFTCAFGTSKTPDSKVSVPNDGKAVWEVGDKIFVHGKEMSTGKVITLTSSDIIDGGKTAKISVDVSGMTAYDPDGYYAAYPADSYVESDGDRAYYYGRWNNTNSPLMSAYLSGDTFLFYNLCGIITFSVSGDFDTYVLSGNSGERVGFELYQVKIVSNDKNYQRTDGTSGPLTTVSGPVTGDGTTVHQVCLPNGANFTDGFTIKLLKSGLPVKTASVKAVDVARGKVLPLGDVTSYLKDYVAPTTHNSSITPVPTDVSDENLSKSGSANCYIVDGSDAANKNKIFKFKAVKGNSSTVLSTIESAVIVWETYNNATDVTANSVIAAVDYDLQEGGDPYIVFKMPNPETPLQAGNALIAVKNGSGDILWSWHIWIPETSVEEADYSAESFMTPKMLDRNLGALREAASTTTANAPESFGLMYQWGRKDPFMGPRAAATSDVAKVAGTSYTRASGHISSETAIANPAQFGKGTNASLDGDWLDTSDPDRWGGSSSTKTINDPCPVGYRVPRASEGKLFSDDDGLSAYTGYGYNKDYFWFKVGDFVSPLASYYDYDGYVSGSGAGTRAIIWSATSHYDPAKKGDYANAQYVYYESGADHSVNWTQRKARAASVRCVAE